MRFMGISVVLLCFFSILSACAVPPPVPSGGEPAAASGASPDLPPVWEPEIAANGQAIAAALNDVLVTLGYQVGRGFDHNIFDDHYIYEDFDHITVFRSWKWVGTHLNESVVLLYLKGEQRFQPMNLGGYLALNIRSIQTTPDPDVLCVDFEDAVFTFGSEYYTRSFLRSLDYSISQDRIVDFVYSPGIGRYGMVGDSISYAQQFRGCEVTGGQKAALRFEVLETSGLPDYPKCTEIILPQAFKAGAPAEILLPHVKMNLSPEFLNEMSGMEGFQSVAAEALETGSEHGTRITATPEPGYTISCGFDSEEAADWEATFYLFAEKAD